ncbi:hypothetical protein C8Q77DRAFT_1162318 [Trametes polyzona]|nr:hypothetical protein C8Q77DRAFT_1162318 [Trametes polyzona]
MASTRSTVIGGLSPPYPTTIGAVALGFLIGMMLYGLTIYQLYVYVRLYYKDRLLIKGFVAIVFGLETVHTALWVLVGYHYVIAQPFTPDVLAHGYWSAQLTVICTSMTIGVTQCFYTCRVYMIGLRHRWLVIPAVVSLLADKGFALAAGIKAFTTTTSIFDFERLGWLISVSYGLAGVTDVILATSLVFVLYRARTGSRRGDSMLDTLILYAIKTAQVAYWPSYSSVVTYLVLILPGNLIYAGISIVGTKLYANSVLAVLNSRREIDDHFFDDFSLAQISCAAGDPGHNPQMSTIVWDAPQRSLSSMSECASIASQHRGQGGVLLAATSISGEDGEEKMSARTSDTIANAC